MAINLKLLQISGKKLGEAKGELNVDLTQAMKDGEVIGISSSQVIDWIFELRGTSYIQLCEQVVNLKQDKSKSKREIREEVDKLVFINEIVRVQFTNQKDFNKYGREFTLNGNKYKFILNKGSETVTYIREDLFDVINEKIEANRDVNCKLVPAKLNAYRMLTMSTSTEVSDTNKVIVVKDCYKEIFQKYLYVSGSQLSITEKEETVSRNINDGYGFVHPNLAKQWSNDLGHQGVDSGFQVRNLWTKGILATFDFIQFATDHDTFNVVDYWGTVRDIRDADIILSESMLKLANAYNSCEEWLNAVNTFGYKWRIAKTTKKQKHGYTNYQMLLPMDLNRNDCRELLSDGVDLMNKIHGRDYVSTTLYLNGSSAGSERMVGDYNLARLLQLEPELLNDKFIYNKILANTKRTKNEMKIGHTLINSSFQVIVGDVIAFAQHILGLEPVGFLGEKEIYSNYHRLKGITEATAFRAPLLCENSIVKVKLNQESQYDKYFEYLNDLYITSSCDLLNESLCGFDYDGDTIQLVSTPTIVNKTKDLLPLICEGVSSEKEICNMDNLFMACQLGVKGAKKYNIGSCINKASSMFGVRSQFDKDSEEYKELSKRIMLSQAISQSWIDYRKSGLAFEMPKHWFNPKGLEMLDVEEQGFNETIMANKKPLFMIDRYERDKTKYNELLDIANLKSISLFGITIKQLMAMNPKDMNEDQITLVNMVNDKVIFNLSDRSTMTIWKEQADELLKTVRNDVNTSTKELLKSGNPYDEKLTKQVRELILTHNNKVQQYQANLHNLETDVEKRHEMARLFMVDSKENLFEEVIETCEDIITATDVMVDVCYSLGKSCDLLFELFGEQIYENVKAKKEYINVIVEDEEGDHEYKYKKYKVEKVAI